MQNDFFDTLLGLPLFQGINRGEFTEVAARIRIARHTLLPGMEVVGRGTPCDSLFFVVSGTVAACSDGDKGNYSFMERFHAPLVLQPERLFGLRTRYAHAFTAESEVRLLEVGKAAVRDVLFNYETFRLNYLNLVCSRLQQAQRHLWRALPEELPERFAQFLHVRCLKPAGYKELRIRMTDLAAELGTSRLSVSRMLNGLEDRGLLQLRRERIVMPSFEKLLQMQGG